MPRDSIRTLVMSAEKDDVKRFLSHMHQSWDQLQVETELQAMETMTAAFIHKFPRVTPELFVDLSQFIPYMSVSDIMSFPASLIVNDTSVLLFRLTAIREHSSGMKSLQKKAFVKRLLQSSVVGDVPTWPPYFLSSILPLLPYLPVSHFQQLTSQQVRIFCCISLTDVSNLRHGEVISKAIDWDPLTVCAALQGSSQDEGKIDGTTLDFLGPLLPFLDRGSLALVDRGALALRLEEMRSFCLPKESVRDISALLTQKDLMTICVFPVQTVLNKDTVEQVLVDQSHWEDSVVGGVCVTQFHNYISALNSLASLRAVPVPSCADIRGTFPSAWTSTQLSRMSQEDLKQCVEVFAQDTSMSPEQRRALWVKLRQFFSPVRELRADQVLALGPVVTEMGERELHDASPTDLGVLAHLGTLTDWSPKKVLNFFIMAVLFLREMSLPCTEQQMETLTSRLSRPEAFGPVSAWGPEVFTEIGTLAVGLEDMVLSALVQEQVEGITPEAIYVCWVCVGQVVFSAVQMSWLSAEQAWAVTEEQWAELDTEQRHAVGLARFEGDVLLELL
uniref:Stereocilin LRR domain-containing protein n=1 Tax=Sander lucioperca TaxID=283035 RepID=A0A8C9XSL6_SANLU